MSDVDNAIRRFSVAHRAADQNSSIMVRDCTREESDQCAERMRDVARAEAAIEALRGREDLPSELVEWHAAVADSACGACWLSSVRSRRHPECAAKLKRFFVARKDLVNSVADEGISLV